MVCAREHSNEEKGGFRSTSLARSKRDLSDVLREIQQVKSYVKYSPLAKSQTRNKRDKAMYSEQGVVLQIVTPGGE